MPFKYLPTFKLGFLMILAAIAISSCGVESKVVAPSRDSNETPAPPPNKADEYGPVDRDVINQIQSLTQEYPDYLLRRLENSQAANLYYEVSHLINASRMYDNPKYYGVDATKLESYIIGMSERVFTPCDGYDFDNGPRQMCRSKDKINGYYAWRSPLNETETYRKSHAKIEWRVAAGISVVIKTILKNTTHDEFCIYEDIPVKNQSANCRAQNLRRLIFEHVWLKWNDLEYVRTTPVDDYIPTANVSHYLSWLELIIEMFEGSAYEQTSIFDKIQTYIEIDSEGFFTFKCRVEGVCVWRGYDFANSNSNDLAHLALPMYLVHKRGIYKNPIIRTLKERTYSDIDGYLFPKFDVFINGHCGKVLEDTDAPLWEHCQRYWVNETEINNHHRQLFGLLPYGKYDPELRDMLLLAADANKDGIIDFNDAMVQSYIVGLYDLVVDE